MPTNPMSAKAIRSGELSINRTDEYYQSEAADIFDRKFKQVVFMSGPALVSKELQDGHRMWKPYAGGEYDQKKFNLVEGKWDHEHCSICNFTITNGHSYWENANQIKLLCDECHEFYIRA